MSSAVAAGTTGEAGASTLPDPGAGDRAGESSEANAEAPSSSGLASQGRKVSTQDIQLVQNLIERCLQMYMSQREVRNLPPEDFVGLLTVALSCLGCFLYF